MSRTRPVYGGRAGGVAASQGVEQPRILPPPFASSLDSLLARLPPPNEWFEIILRTIVLNPIAAAFESIQEILFSPRTHRVVLRLGVLGAVFYSALALAILAYVGFYRAWVPHVGVRKDVYLQYGYNQPPFAELLFMPGDVNSSATSTGSSSFFAEDQEYDVTLELNVPLSAANLDLGNFMVALDLSTDSGKTLHSASRPFLLIHEPAPIRQLSQLSAMMSRNPPEFSLARTALPAQLLTIPLLKRALLAPSQSFSIRQEDPNTRKVSRGRVTVGRRDAEMYWRYGGGHGVGGVESAVATNVNAFRSRGELQTYSASLKFDAHLTGLRFLMYHHPLFSFVVFTAGFLIFELTAALTLWGLAALYTSSLAPGGPSLATEDNRIQSTRSRRRRYGEEDEFDETDATSRGPATGVSSAYEDEAERGLSFASSLSGTESDSDGQFNSAAGASRASLRARDAAERAEARRAEAARDSLEGRRMTAVDAGASAREVEREHERQRERDRQRELDMPASGRVLGRLDEETEEETEPPRSRRSSVSVTPNPPDLGDDEEAEEEDDGVEINWEDVGQQRDTLRRRRVGVEGSEADKAPLSTVGGSSTSRASSVRSFGATSYANTATTAATGARPTPTSAEAESSSSASRRAAPPAPRADTETEGSSASTGGDADGENEERDDGAGALTPVETD